MRFVDRLAAAMLSLALILPSAVAPALANDIGNAAWSETDSSNNATPPNGFPENMLPSTVDDSARATMGAVRRWWDHANATLVSSGSANVQTLTYSVAPSAYFTGQTFAFIAGFSNSGPTTLNVNGLGAKSVLVGSTALLGGEIVTGHVVTVYYDGTNFQLASAPVGGFAGRIQGTTTVGLSVATTGSDSNPCTAGSPCATLQRAVSLALSQYDLRTNSITISVADGSYQGFQCFYPLVGGNQSGIQIIGTDGSGLVTIADTTTNAAAVIASGGCVLDLVGLKITSLHGAGLFPQAHAHIYTGTDVNIGSTALGQVHSETGGIAEIVNGITFSGGATAALQAVLGGRIIFDENAQTVTTSGTPAYSIAFADIEDGSELYINSNFVTFAGTGATGARFLNKTYGRTRTISGGATFLPGNALGSNLSGGSYDPITGPTIGTLTGLGTGGSPGGVLLSGSSDEAGTIQLTTGTTGMTGSGNVPLTFGTKLGANGVSCASPGFTNGSGGWGNGVNAEVQSLSSTGAILVWNNVNNGSPTPLSASSAYYLNWICRGY